MPFFPNTLELERRLCALGAHQVLDARASQLAAF